MVRTEVFDLTGKVALVTGATKGIGEAVARGFAAAGARVYLHGRDAAQGERLASDLGGVFLPADLSDPAAVRGLARSFLEREERLDVLVNNAGFEVAMPIGAIDADVFARIWQVNVAAPVMLIEALLDHLKAARGSIINMTSIHDRVPYPHNCAYAMSKSALTMYTMTASVELAPHGVRVNSLAPGAIATDMNREVIEEMGDEGFREWIPAGRVGHVDEMIGPAVFLASDASSYVNGATLYADGGYRHNLVRYRL